MACNPPVPPAPGGKTPVELFDDGYFRVYQMQHLCIFVSDLAGNIEGQPRQIDELRAESLQVVFGLIADQLQLAQDEMIESFRLEREKAA